MSENFHSSVKEIMVTEGPDVGRVRDIEIARDAAEGYNLFLEARQENIDNGWREDPKTMSEADRDAEKSRDKELMNLYIIGEVADHAIHASGLDPQKHHNARVAGVRNEKMLSGEPDSPENNLSKSIAHKVERDITVGLGRKQWVEQIKREEAEQGE